jgi:hypothetical protein
MRLVTEGDTVVCFNPGLISADNLFKSVPRTAEQASANLIIVLEHKLLHDREFSSMISGHPNNMLGNLNTPVCPNVIQT